MKTLFNIIALNAVLFLTISCSPSKDQNVGSTPDKPETTKEQPAVADFISGKVTEIQPGKDGYTAKIITASGQEYFATISRANLTDPVTYRSVAVGDSLTVKGDHWEMENQDHITVRELK